MYIRNSRGKVCAIFSINYDISKLMMVESAVRELTSTGEPAAEGAGEDRQHQRSAGRSHPAVRGAGGQARGADEQGRQGAGHPLSQRQNGAFLVTKSGDKVARYFGISKYTLYSYIDTKQENKRQEGKSND
jgi:predicted transcriptional regulator YheO